MTSKQCSQCNKKIHLKQNTILYRCCDADLCSYTCSLNRFKTIKNYDPELIFPNIWSKLDSITYSNKLSCNKSSSNNLIKRSKSLPTFYKRNNISKYNKVNHDKITLNISTIKIIRFITIRLIALGLIVYNVLSLFTQ